MRTWPAQLWARFRRWGHCLYSLMPWRVRRIHRTVTLTYGITVLKLSCSCGRTFWDRGWDL